MKWLDSVKQHVQSFRAPEFARYPLHLVKTLAQDLIRCDLLKQASAMAYVTLLSLIPSLVAIFCVLSLFTPLFGKKTNLVDTIREFILSNLASGSGEQVTAYLDRMIASLDLASIGWSAFASVLFTLILLLKQIEEALNRIWLIRKGRNALSRFMYFWTFLTLGVVIIAILLGMTSGFDLTAVFSLKDEVSAQKGIVGSLIAWGGGFLFFFFLYKIVPNCFVGARDAAIGAAVAALLLHQGSRLYGIFVRDADNYQTLYGALAQLPVFLMWLYFSWIIILLGAVITWRMQQGFPVVEEKETLDGLETPTEEQRNFQVRATLPLITMLAIYRNFQDGTGKGLTGQDLASKLKLPVGWVTDTLEYLEALGYVIASKASIHEEELSNAVVDPYYPAYPATGISLGKLQDDLAAPFTHWLAHWHHELPLDVAKALDLVTGPERLAYRKLSLAEALERLPAPLAKAAQA